MPVNDGLMVLPSGAGYGIVIGIGGIFALIMLGITWLQNRYVCPQEYQYDTLNAHHESSARLPSPPPSPKNSTRPQDLSNPASSLQG